MGLWAQRHAVDLPPTPPLDHMLPPTAHGMRLSQTPSCAPPALRR